MMDDCDRAYEDWITDVLEGRAASPADDDYWADVLGKGELTMTTDDPATVPIVIGQEYEFVSEVEEETTPLPERLRQYTGQKALVLSLAEHNDPENSTLYNVRFADGRVAQAWEDELNGWDKALGQFFAPIKEESLRTQFAVLVDVGTDWPEVVFVGEWSDATKVAFQLNLKGADRVEVTALVSPEDALEEIAHGGDFE